MSEQQQIHQPGKHEAAALVMMNEIERPTARPQQHVVVDQEAPGIYRAHTWSAAADRWQPDSRLLAGAIRLHALAFLESLLASANVTITDERIEFAELDGCGPDEFDDCALHPARIVFCPEGKPNAPDEWVGTGAKGGYINDQSRFPKVSLLEQFREATAVPSSPSPNYIPKAATVFVRHDVAAREFVPKERWSFSGRPDLMGRMVDEELRRNAEQADQDAEDWKTPEGQGRVKARQMRARS